MTEGRLLIVEDDRVVSFSLKMFFENMDFRADVAVNGEEAWEMIKVGDYDLILRISTFPGCMAKRF